METPLYSGDCDAFVQQEKDFLKKSASTTISGY